MSPAQADRVTNRRRSDIQGLRALAVVLVVLFHAGLHVPGGFTGVDVFFVISGFVITQMLAAELVDSGTLVLRRFYARRIRRLFPALALLLVFVAVVGPLATPQAAQHIATRTGIAAAVFSANVYVYHLGTGGYFAVESTLNPLLHTWTLAVEEQFYLFFPVFLLVSWRLGSRSGHRARAVALAALAGVTCLSFGLSVATSRGKPVPGIGSPQGFAFYSSPTRAWEFGVGAVLALAMLGRQPLGRAVATPVGALGLALVLVGAFRIHGSYGYPGLAALLPVAGAAMLLAAERGAASRVLTLAPVVLIGDLSYSWYLWHWPFIVFARALTFSAGWATPTAAVVSLVPAWMSYRYVEEPIRHGPGRRIGARSIAAACLALPLLLLTATIPVDRAIASSTAVRQWTLSQAHHLDYTDGCMSAVPLGKRAPGTCLWRTPGATGTVVLIGDSNAGQFAEPLVAAAKAVRADAVVATLDDCPFADVSIVQSNYAALRPLCRNFYTGSLRYMLRTRPSLVVIAARPDKYISRSGFTLSYGRHWHGSELAAWKAGLRSTVQQLSRRGIHVDVVHPVPSLQFDSGGCATLLVVTWSCKTTRPRAAIAAARRTLVATENAAVAPFPTASAVDFIGAVCGATSCSTIAGHTDLYRDPLHLSVAGASLLEGRFERLIRSAVR